MTRIPDSITICITSCNRIDLLTRTLTSFRRFNFGGRYLLSEDSADASAVDAISSDFQDIEIFSGPRRLGLMGSIDRLYSQVQTPFIFHLEDDWEFSGPVGWEAALAALDQHPALTQICVRDFGEIREKHRKRSILLRLDDVEFRVMKASAHPEFFGWSTNPGLIRTDLYKKHAPFARLLHDQMSALIKQESGTMAFLLPGVARHIGQSRNVTDPTMPARPSSRLKKWIRGIKKKLYYMGLRRQPF